MLFFTSLIAKWFIYHKEEKFNDFRLPEGDNTTSQQRDIATSRQRDIATMRHYDGWFVPSRDVALAGCNCVEHAASKKFGRYSKIPDFLFLVFSSKYFSS